jgi:hypothetical protein
MSRFIGACWEKYNFYIHPIIYLRVHVKLYRNLATIQPCLNLATVFETWLLVVLTLMMSCMHDTCFHCPFSTCINACVSLSVCAYAFEWLHDHDELLVALTLMMSRMMDTSFPFRM